MTSEKRLISIDEALKATHNEIYWTESQQAAVRSFLVQQPRVDAVEVVHGRWLRVYDDSAGWVDMCNKCKEFGEGTRYCPNCGAKMDGDGNG